MLRYLFNGERGESKRTRSKSEVEPWAFVVAADLMKQAPGAIDWSGWLVSVARQAREYDRQDFLSGYPRQPPKAGDRMSVRGFAAECRVVEVSQAVLSPRTACIPIQILVLITEHMV
jgi:hypothetical protein